VLHALITTLAQAHVEEEETSKTAFYVAGSVLAVFAVIISAIGIRGHETFPPSGGAMRAVIGLAALLVGATMATAIITG
jgi:drug/metabolite transporter (DMT)-like permease